MNTALRANSPANAAKSETNNPSSTKSGWSWLWPSRSNSSTPANTERKSTLLAAQPKLTAETRQDKLRRRLEVCDRLKILALETNDSRLEQAVCELEDLIWQWYWQEQRQRLGEAQTVSWPRGNQHLAPNSSPTVPDRFSSSLNNFYPETQLPAPHVHRPVRHTSALNGVSAGISYHERLDMHTIRGSAPDSPPPVIDSLPRVNGIINTSEEARR